MARYVSYEEYKTWCASRFPPLEDNEPAPGFCNTLPADGDEPCPVTVRSARFDRVVVTPRPKGST